MARSRDGKTPANDRGTNDQGANSQGAGPVKEPPSTPRGELMIRTLAMPADTNQNGDIFGGWVLGQMDIAGGVCCFERAKGRVATVAVESMSFHHPVRVGDVLCCYVDIVRVGRSSITTDIEAWILRRGGGMRMRVTEGRFTYVAIDEKGKPRPVPPKGDDT